MTRQILADPPATCPVPADRFLTAAGFGDLVEFTTEILRSCSHRIMRVVWNVAAASVAISLLSTPSQSFAPLSTTLAPVRRAASLGHYLVARGDTLALRSLAEGRVSDALDASDDDDEEAVGDKLEAVLQYVTRRPRCRVMLMFGSHGRAPSTAATILCHISNMHTTKRAHILLGTATRSRRAM